MLQQILSSPELMKILEGVAKLSYLSLLYIAKEAKEMRREAVEMRTSIQQLNTNVAVIIERVSSHEKRLDKHDDDIKMISEKMP